MNGKQAGKLGTNLLIKKAVNWTLGLIICPFFIVEFGYWRAFLIMLVIASITGYACVIIYDKIKMDLFCLEAFKKAQEEGSVFTKDNFLTRLILKFFDREWLVVGLIVFTDSVITVIYFRPNYFLFNGFQTRKTRRLFFISVITIALFWIFFVWAGFSIFRLVFGIELTEAIVLFWNWIKTILA